MDFVVGDDLEPCQVVPSALEAPFDPAFAYFTPDDLSFTGAFTDVNVGFYLDDFATMTEHSKQLLTELDVKTEPHSPNQSIGGAVVPQSPVFSMKHAFSQPLRIDHEFGDIARAVLEPMNYQASQSTTASAGQPSPTYSSDDNMSTPEFDGNEDLIHELIMPWIAADINKKSYSWNIPQNAALWSATDTRTWWLETVRSLGMNADHWENVLWTLTGAELCQMTVVDFHNLDPLCGEKIHGCFHIWTSAHEYKRRQEEQAASYRVTPSPTSSPLSSPLSATSILECSTPAEESGMTGASHIQLWRFIRQLLDDDRHQSIVRWISAEEGIFKIEDSQALARMWGRRKNRPLMNYDKLSRSLRQYYRKGILKKTSRAQRLVYQFCPAYMSGIAPSASPRYYPAPSFASTSNRASFASASTPDFM